MSLNAALAHQINDLLRVMPDFEHFSPVNEQHSQWLTVMQSRLAVADPRRASEFRSAADMLVLHATRPVYIAEMRQIIGQVLAQIE